MQKVILCITILCISHGWAFPADSTTAVSSGPDIGAASGRVLNAMSDLPNSQKLAECVNPVWGFAFSVGFTSEPGAEGPTREQFTEGCTVAKNLLQCVDSWTGSLGFAVSPDVTSVLQGTKEFLAECDKPNVYENVTRFIKCGKKLQELPNECRDLKEAQRRSEQKFSNAEPLTVLKEVKFMDDYCCDLKKVTPCVKSKIERICGAADRDFASAMLNRLNTVYKCDTRTRNCQATAA